VEVKRWYNMIKRKGVGSMSKLEKDLSEDRKAKILAARRYILEIEEQANYTGPTNENGAPVVVSHGLTIEDLLKED